MARFERLLIPIIAVVMVAAILLEGLGPSGVRTIALSLGVLLVVAIVVGMWHRVRKKLRTARPDEASDHTSND